MIRRANWPGWSRGAMAIAIRRPPLERMGRLAVQATTLLLAYSGLRADGPAFRMEVFAVLPAPECSL